MIQSAAHVSWLFMYEIMHKSVCGPSPISVQQTTSTTETDKLKKKTNVMLMVSKYLLKTPGIPLIYLALINLTQYLKG